MSAERALLIRTATTAGGQYFAVGIDFPSVRVFDTTRGALCHTVEPPKRSLASLSVLRSAASLSGTIFCVSLVSLAFRDMGDGNSNGSSVLIAMGLSDGTVVLHDVTRNELIKHISVSETQQDILSISFAGSLMLALSKGGSLYALDVQPAGNVGVLGCAAVSKTATALASVTSARSGGEALVLVAGPVSALYKVSVLRSSDGAATLHLDKLKSFMVQTSAVNFAWLSPSGSVASTCGAQEGVVRIWDLSDSNAKASCKFTLNAGARVGHVRILEASGESVEQGAAVVVTTFFGEVLLWTLGASLAPRVAMPQAVEPALVLTSSASSAKILVGHLLEHGTASSRQLLLVRGRFATPRFEGRELQPLLQDSFLSKLIALPLLGSAAGCQRLAADIDDGTAPPLPVDLDNEWASHRAVSTRAMVTPTEEFVLARSAQAANVASLPTAAADSSLVAGASTRFSAITVPLYQALHAGDYSVVMELLTVSSRTDNEIIACVSALQLPYALQLLRVLGERAKTATVRSQIFRWITAIVRLRGNEIASAQRVALDADVAEQPKAFVAPLLAQYRQLTSTYDKLSTAYGRLSIFKSVKPLEPTHNARKGFDVVHTDTAVTNGISFPQTFKVVDVGNGNPPRVVRQQQRKRLELKHSVWRRKRGASKSKRDGDVLAEDKDEDEVSDDDDMSLDSDEMNEMLEAGGESLALDDRATSKRRRAEQENLAVVDEDEPSSGDDEANAEDFDEASDDLLDSDFDEESDEESEVDSSPYEEGEDDGEDRSDDAEGTSDDDSGGDSSGQGGGEEDDGYGLGRKSRAANEKRVKTD